MTKAETSDLVYGVAGGIAGWLGFMAILLLGFTMIGMVRR